MRMTVGCMNAQTCQKSSYSCLMCCVNAVHAAGKAPADNRPGSLHSALLDGKATSDLQLLLQQI